jgi:translation initiation factor 4E
LLALIGEAFDDSDEICGAVVSVRKGSDRISVWTKSTSKDSTIRIGKKLRQVLHLPNGAGMGFQSHHASANKSSSYPNDMYSLKD